MGFAHHLRGGLPLGLHGPRDAGRLGVPAVRRGLRQERGGVEGEGCARRHAAHYWATQMRTGIISLQKRLLGVTQTQERRLRGEANEQRATRHPGGQQRSKRICRGEVPSAPEAVKRTRLDDQQLATANLWLGLPLARVGLCRRVVVLHTGLLVTVPTHVLLVLVLYRFMGNEGVCPKVMC